MELSGPPVPSVPTRSCQQEDLQKCIVHLVQRPLMEQSGYLLGPYPAVETTGWSKLSLIEIKKKKNDLGHLMSLKTCVLDSLDKSPYVMRLTVMEKWQWCSWSKWYRQQKPNFHPSTSVEHGTHNVVFSNIQDEGVVTMKSSATMQFFVGVFNEPVL